MTPSTRPFRMLSVPTGSPVPPRSTPSDVVASAAVGRSCSGAGSGFASSGGIDRGSSIGSLSRSPNSFIAQFRAAGGFGRHVAATRPVAPSLRRGRSLPAEQPHPTGLSTFGLDWHGRVTVLVERRGRQLHEALRCGGSGRAADDGDPFVDRLQIEERVIGQLERDAHPEGAFDVPQAEDLAGEHVVEDERCLRPDRARLGQVLEQRADGLERRDLRVHRQDHRVRVLEHDQRALVEERSGVDDHGVVLRELALEQLFDVARLDELAELRRRWRRDDVKTAVVAGRVRPEELGLCERRLVADDVGQRVPRVEVEMRRDGPELKVEVEEHDLVRAALRLARGDVGRDRRRPDAALGTEHRDDAMELGKHRPVERQRRSEILRSLEAEQQRLDPRLELSTVEGLRHDVVGTGLEEPDPILDLVGLADAEDGRLDCRRRGADLPDDVERRLAALDDADDDELVLGHECERVVRIALGRDGVAEPREDAADQLAGGGVGLEEQDCAGGHGASGWTGSRSRGLAGGGAGKRIHGTARATPAPVWHGRAEAQRCAGAARARDARLTTVSFRLRPGRRPAPNGAYPQEGVSWRMRRYELMLVLRPDVPDDRSQAVIDRTTRQISAGGGQIVKVAPWGRRRLAYPIDRHRDGSYHIVLFEAPAPLVAEVERGLTITEELLRHLITRVD